MTEARLRRINDALTVLVIGICLYVLLTPLWPMATFVIENKEVPYQITSSVNDSPKPRPEGSRLLIPSIGLDQEIHTGGRESLSKGVWLRPNASTPEKGSNTVLVGHRFTYTESNAVFYHLDKINTGELIGIYWDNREFNYRVREIKIVPATAVEIESATVNPTLTLYTCTPIWSAKDRLVIVADLIYEEQI